jgi:SulP family sulfate permease
MTVFVDLITAVGVGLILAGFVTAKWMEDEELKGVTYVAIDQNAAQLTATEKKALRKSGEHIAIVCLRGRFSYASAREMVKNISAVTPAYHTIIFDFSDAAHIDTSAALAIDEIIEVLQSEHSRPFISGLSGQAEKTLKGLGVLGKLPPNSVFESRMEAIGAAVAIG